MTYATLLVDRRDYIAWITLNRPERLNALNLELMNELTDVMNDIAEDDAVRVAVIRGAGRGFGAGADLKEQYEHAKDPTFGRLLIKTMRRLQASIDNCPKVSIAAVSGLAFAGSLEIMMTCDLAIATDDCQLSDQHANFGLPPVGSSTQRLPRLVGARKAMELLMTGISITGKEAAAIGLVNRSVPVDQFDAAVEDFARSIADKSPLVTAMIKELVDHGMQADFTTGMVLEKWAGYASGAWEDVHEGIAAFNEKRRPDYKGR
ncbi:MAG: enoyl-CoA hydratase/isomerase family protein [Acidimicrobiia bacterium]